MVDATHAARFAPGLLDPATPAPAGLIGPHRYDVHRNNVTVSLGDAHDPRLPPASVDVALMIHMYHEIEQPFGLLYNLLPALRPGARLGILDTTRPTQQHGTPLPLLDCELGAVGYRRVATLPLENGAEYLAVFEPPARAPDPATIRPCQP